MDWDNRIFSETKLDTPKIEDELTRNLFRGLTESRVDMLNAIKHEGKQRVKRDNELLEEMHSFGIISVDPSSAAAKFFIIDVDVSGIAIPCRSGAGESKTLTVDMTRSITLHKCNETADTVMIEGACYFVDGYSVNVCGYIQKRSGGVVLYLSLGGSAYVNGAIYIPDGRTDIATTIDHVHAYT